MSNTTVPATLTYLVAAFKADPTLSALTAPDGSGLTVIDGPVPVPGPLPLSLWVGCDDPEAAVQGHQVRTADATQEWAAIGRAARDELVTVYCCAGAFTGNVDEGFAPVRDSVAAVLNAVENFVRADTGVPNLLMPTPGVTGYGWRQLPKTDGLHVFATLQLDYRCRI